MFSFAKKTDNTDNAQQPSSHSSLSAVGSAMCAATVQGALDSPVAPAHAGAAGSTESFCSLFWHLTENSLHHAKKPSVRGAAHEFGGGGAATDPAFEQWWKSIAGYEGSLASWEKQPANKHDRGGKTNWGVTHATYMSTGPLVGLEPSEEAFRSMTVPQAAKIGYYFWKQAGCHLIKDVGVTIVIADWFWGSGYSGTKRIQKVLKQFGYKGKIDGHIGQTTADLINTIPAGELINAITAGREQHFHDIIAHDPSQKRFEKGWLRRARERGAEGLHFAGQSREDLHASKGPTATSKSGHGPEHHSEADGVATNTADTAPGGHGAEHGHKLASTAAKIQPPIAASAESANSEAAKADHQWESDPVLDSAGAAFHDGSNEHALGSGDEVFDADGQVIPAFSSDAAGVVAAALYELHRGEKRSLAEIQKDDGGGRTRRGAQAATELNKKGDKAADNTDLSNGQVIGHLPGRGGMRPIDSYLKSAKTARKNPWCGAFATFVYKRAGIHTESLAYSLDVQNVLAKLGNADDHGSYYRINARKGKNKRFTGALENGSYSQKGARYHKTTGANSALDIDIRPGDVLWLQHNNTKGHVGIIIGVHKNGSKIQIVSVEGNVGDQLTAQTRTMVVDAKNHQCSASFKGWGRPPELQSDGPAAPAAEGDHDEGGDDVPGWIEHAVAEHPEGKKVSDR